MPRNGNRGHRFHRGSFEGMRQKEWTILTINAILAHAFLHGYSITILGQGDNQVICHEIPMDYPSPDYVEKYLSFECYLP